MELWLKVEHEEKEARECLKFLLVSMFYDSRKVESLRSAFASKRE
jgi:hypothetical protein